MKRLRIITGAYFYVGGAFAAGGAVWALREAGTVHPEGFIITAAGYIMLVLAVFLADAVKEYE